MDGRGAEDNEEGTRAPSGFAVRESSPESREDAAAEGRAFGALPDPTSAGFAKLERVRRRKEAVNAILKDTDANYQEDKRKLSLLKFEELDGNPKELLVQDAVNGYSDAEAEAERALAEVREITAGTDLAVRRWSTFRLVADAEWWKGVNVFGSNSVLRDLPLSVEGVAAFVVVQGLDPPRMTVLYSAQVGGKYTLAGVRVEQDGARGRPAAAVAGAYRALEARPAGDPIFPSEPREAFFLDGVYPLVDVTDDGTCVFAVGAGLCSEGRGSLMLNGYRLARVPLSALFRGDEGDSVECVNVDCFLPEACATFMRLDLTRASTQSWCNPYTERASGEPRRTLVPLHAAGVVVVDMNDLCAHSASFAVRRTLDHGLCLSVLGGCPLLMAIPGHRLRCTLLPHDRTQYYREDENIIRAGLRWPRERKDLMAVCRETAVLEEAVKRYDGSQKLPPLIVTPVFSSKERRNTRYHIRNNDFYDDELFGDVLDEPERESGIPADDPIVTAMLETNSLKRVPLQFHGVSTRIREVLRRFSAKEWVSVVVTGGGGDADRTLEKTLMSLLLTEEAAASFLAEEMSKKFAHAAWSRKVIADDYIEGTRNDTGISSAEPLSPTDSARSVAASVRNWLAVLTETAREEPVQFVSSKTRVSGKSLAVVELARCVTNLVLRAPDPDYFLHACVLFLQSVRDTLPPVRAPPVRVDLRKEGYEKTVDLFFENNASYEPARDHWMAEAMEARYAGTKRLATKILAAYRVQREREEMIARQALCWTMAVSVLADAAGSRRSAVQATAAWRWFHSTYVRNRILDATERCKPSAPCGSERRASELARYLLSAHGKLADMKDLVYLEMKRTAGYRENFKTLLAERFVLNSFSDAWRKSLCEGTGAFLARGLSASPEIASSGDDPGRGHFSLAPIPRHVTAPQFVRLRQSFKSESSARELLALANRATGSAVAASTPRWVSARRCSDRKRDRKGRPGREHPVSDLCRPVGKHSASREDLGSCLLFLRYSAWHGRLFGPHTDARTALSPVMDRVYYEQGVVRSIAINRAPVSNASVHNVADLYGESEETVARVLNYNPPVELLLEFHDGSAVNVNASSEVMIRESLVSSFDLNSHRFRSTSPPSVVVPHRRFMFCFTLYGQRLMKKVVARRRGSTKRKSAASIAQQNSVNSRAKRLCRRTRAEMVCLRASLSKAERAKCKM